MTPEVLITGAGPTGLVLALWLTRLGVKIRIIDKTAAPGTTSRAMAVHARTLELYGQEPGLAPEVIADGHKVESLNIWTGGRRTATVPLGVFGEHQTPYPFVLTYPQDAHEKLLIKHLESAGVTVERQTELVSFVQDTSGIRAKLKNTSGEIEEVAATYLCGCDGAHSTVRAGLGMSFEGGTYSQIFYVADVEAEGAVVADKQGYFCLNPKDFCLVFPLKGNNIRLIGVVPDGVKKDISALTFDDVAARVTVDTQLTVKKVNWFSAYHTHHRMADSFRRDRVFLLGDAAHIHSPAGGQGMNTGIGDAINLAWKLKAVLRGEAAADILGTYATERMGFARQLLKTTDKAFRFVTGGTYLGGLLRSFVLPHLLPLLFKIPGIGGKAFRTISQIGISYPLSPLSAGRGKDVAHSMNRRISGGDRMPVLKDPENAAALNCQRWNLQVYGETPAEVEVFAAEQGLPLFPFPYSAEAEIEGIAPGGFLLVRPDGNVAFSGGAGDVPKLREYVMRWQLIFR